MNAQLKAISGFLLVTTMATTAAMAKPFNDPGLGSIWHYRSDKYYGIGLEELVAKPSQDYQNLWCGCD